MQPTDLLPLIIRAMGKSTQNKLFGFPFKQWPPATTLYSLSNFQSLKCSELKVFQSSLLGLLQRWPTFEFLFKLHFVPDYKSKIWPLKKITEHKNIAKK